jgi:hypothetical protein
MRVMHTLNRMLASVPRSRQVEHEMGTTAAKWIRKPFDRNRLLLSGSSNNPSKKWTLRL